MPKYEMLIHVDSAEDMAIIVQACKGTAELISTNKVKEDKRRAPRRSAKPPSRGANVATEGLKGIDVARQLYADGKPHSSKELADIFSSKGFNPNSASPALSHLHVKTHEVKQLTLGNYIATPKLRPVNSGADH